MLGQQLKVEGEADKNVPLYYYITDSLRIQFGKEEFCLVTGLKFGVENLAEYEDAESRIPFRRRVFPSNLDGEQITGTMVYKIIDSELFDRLDDDDAVSLGYLGILQLVLLGVEGKRSIPAWLLRLANDRDGWDNYPWGSHVWPTLYSQLKNANVKRWPKLYGTQPTSEVDIKSYTIFGYTWAFKTWILESFRVTATIYYYRYNRHPRVAAWKKRESFWQPWLKVFFSKRLTPDETEARSDWWIFSRAYFDGRIGVAKRVPRHREQRSSFYKRSPYMEQPATTVLPKQRGGDDVVYLGGRFTGNYLVYENVDPEKVKRENYVTYTEFLNNPEEVYLDCYMKGYLVPLTFWQQLVPHLCKLAIDSRTPVGN
nr:phospholipase-like protein [Tanacetum cinerariifolium]